eukprot:Seg1510.2 transcript_id=Seg1510.2/GoldUCD/mRNA.D3Y31 product="hypothetical protein" protein_id=Seg1510.2/GoldUCD/D3Y31
MDFLVSKDGSNKFVINRDDAAGFRLDTTYTHKQRKLICNVGQPELTTRTDYVSKYSSILQTTSYLFKKTDEASEERPVGVFKANVLFQKSAAQHAADFVMLQKLPELKKCTDQKEIEYFQVDGAGDENPAFLEVQFYWTECHYCEGRTCTLLTARNSGGSYLNRVELLNGCLAIGHSGVFIPSTIHGSNISKSSGKVDKEKLCQNLNSALDVYIDWVSGITFDGKAILLLKGDTSKTARQYHERRHRLNIFLKGPKYKKNELEKTHSEEFGYFQMIWTIRCNHMVQNLPNNYMFMLLPCNKVKCPHKVCAEAGRAANCAWYKDGPKVSFLPLPVKDPRKPWGSINCQECIRSGKDVCSGHYLPVDEIIEIEKQGNTPNYCRPPREIIQCMVKENHSLSRDLLEKLAEECLLPIEEVEMCVDHYYQIAKRRKASGMNRRKSHASKEGKYSDFNNDEVLRYQHGRSTSSSTSHSKCQIHQLSQRFH